MNERWKGIKRYRFASFGSGFIGLVDSQFLFLIHCRLKWCAYIHTLTPHFLFVSSLYDSLYACSHPIFRFSISSSSHSVVSFILCPFLIHLHFTHAAFDTQIHLIRLVVVFFSADTIFACLYAIEFAAVTLTSNFLNLSSFFVITIIICIISMSFSMHVHEECE